jgi:hypothetical protein
LAVITDSGASKGRAASVRARSSRCWARPTGTSRLIWSKTFFSAGLVDVVGGQGEAHRRHATADVHPHRRRDDGLVGGEYGADGGADATVDVRHGGDVVVDEG